MLHSTVAALEWRPDSGGLAVGGYNGVSLFRVKSGIWATQPYEELEWKGSVLAVAWSPSGRYVAYVANIDGYSRLELKDLGSNLTKRPTGLPAGLISNLRFDARGTQLGLTIESATSPRDAWSYDIEKETASRWARRPGR